MMNVPNAGIVDVAGRTIVLPLSPAPVSDHPPMDVGASLTFHNSSHSSDVERDDPDQATSPMTIVGVVSAAAGGIKNGFSTSNPRSRPHKTGRTDEVCLGIGV